MNRAERRRRGITRRRITRTGSLASAGVFLSVGLFGAYVGNPRLQPAFASVCTGGADVTVSDDTGLRAALSDSSKDCILVDGTVTLASDLPTIDDTSWGVNRATHGLTLYGNPTDGTDTITGNKRGVAVYLRSSTGTLGLSMSDLTMSNLYTPSLSGGAVYVKGYSFAGTLDIDVRLTDMTFVDNATNNLRGGAVYARSETVSGSVETSVTVAGSTFTSNEAVNNGGAIYAYSRNDYFTHPGSSSATVVTITDTTFTDNASAFTKGGAVFAGSRDGVTTFSATDSTFVSNEAPLEGGALALRGHGDVLVNLNTSTFRDNSSGYFDGGAIYAFSYDDVSIASQSSSFLDNTAGRSGGGIHAYGYDGDVSVTSQESTFSGNISGMKGGAVFGYSYSGDVSVNLQTSTFDGNIADTYGGAIYSSAGAVIYGSSFVGNRVLAMGPYAPPNAGRGGAVYTRGDVSITNSFFGGNYAKARAGAVHAGGAIDLDFSTVYDNTVGSSTPEAIYTSQQLTARGSAVGASSGSGNLVAAASVDDSFSVSTSSTGVFTGPGSANVALAGLGLGSLDDTASPGHGGRSPNATSPLVIGAPSTALGTGITTDQQGIPNSRPSGSPPVFTIGARQASGSTPTPVPDPVYPPSAPREVTAVADNASGLVSWRPPESPGSFPITHYEVMSSPGMRPCLVSAPVTSCRVEGLVNGGVYTFTVRALNGAGWGGVSSASSPITPIAASIVITGSRESPESPKIRVTGVTTGLIGQRVTPFVKFPGQQDYTAGVGARLVRSDGTFTWQRTSPRKTYVYFATPSVRSNALTFPPRQR